MSGPVMSLWVRRLTHPQVLVGGVLLLAIIGVALAADRLYPGDPLDIVAAPLIPAFSDSQHWLGTDQLGRDIAAGIVHGSQASLRIGLTAASIGVLIGTLVGALSGYFGGWTETILMRSTEIIQTTPPLLFVIVIITAMGEPSMQAISLAIGVTSWPVVARLARAQFRTLASSEFVTAARSLGYSPARIILHEILPNALPPIIVTGSVLVAVAILLESALAFMGQGDPNRISWGTMIGSGRDLLRTSPSLTLLPGTALVATMLCLNLLGDGLNEVLNPRLSERR
jgi:peptide/nickel transport system permease protein